MSTPTLRIRGGHPDFLDLPWERSLTEWDHPRRLHLPKGISRHEVRFFGYETGIYAVKELPIASARHEYDILVRLETLTAPSVAPVGVVERTWVDPTSESSGAVITEYLNHSFSYRELLSGAGFGRRRDQMLDAFALLLVEVHLLGCFWGDCSLSNVLYRFDAERIAVTMVDAETAQLQPELSVGQREDDLQIMIHNVAGGMADIAASRDADLEHADLALGEEIADRYRNLWAEVTHDEVFEVRERYRITERIKRINELGFEVRDLQVESTDAGHRLRLGVTVGGRRFHSGRLRTLTGVDATEDQARQILTDLDNYRLGRPDMPEGIAAVHWRADVFEPLLGRIRELPIRHVSDPIQGFCDFLHHRFAMSTAEKRDVHNAEAFEAWIEAGQPGYPF